MPSKDMHHDAVVDALTQAGWTEFMEQISLVVGERRVWIDIWAGSSDGRQAAFVEVKGFQNMRSPVDCLAYAIGQYMLYRVMISHLEVDLPLYMAVPESA